MAASSDAVGEGDPPHKAGVEAVPPQPAAFPVDQALSLLLVDSKPEATAPLLQQSGYRVTAVSCLDAVAQQLSSSQHPDMIVCDWQQGGAGQLLGRLKSRPDWSSIPVVVMSTEAAPAAVIAAMRAGAADFLVQPLRSNEVSMLWQHVWRRRSATLPCSIAATGKAPSASDNTFASISGSDSGASAATGLQLPGSCTAATDSDGNGGLPQNSFTVSGGSRTASSAGSHLAALSAALLGDMPGCDLLSAPHRALFQPLGSKNHQAAANSAFGTGCQPKPSFGASSLGSGQRRIALFRASSGSPPLTSADLATSSGSTAAAAAAATSSGGDVAVSMDATPSQHDDALSNAACSLASLASCPPEQLEALRAFSGSLFGQPPSPSGDLSIAPLDVTPLQPPPPRQQRTVFSAPPQRPQHRLRTPAAPSQPRANSARTSELQHQAAIGRAGSAHGIPPPQMPASHAASAADAAAAEAASKADAKAACAAHRRAAILKFKQKREQRSFDKKVRYVSRKRLAESRPRVRGQFVKAEVAAACRTLAAAQQAEAEKGSGKAVAVAAQ